MIEFHCTSCNKLLRTADDKAGKRARCPECGETVAIPGAAPAGAEFDDYGGADDYGDPDEDRYGLSSSPRARSSGGGRRSDMKNCPMCGGEVRAAAVKCRYCGERLGGARPATRPRSRRRSSVPQTSGTATAAIITGAVGLATSLMSLCCFFGLVSLPCSIAAVVLGFVSLPKINAGEAEGKGLAIAGLVMGFVGLAVTLGLWALMFAARAR